MFCKQEEPENCLKRAGKDKGKERDKSEKGKKGDNCWEKALNWLELPLYLSLTIQCPNRAEIWQKNTKIQRQIEEQDRKSKDPYN